MNEVWFKNRIKAACLYFWKTTFIDIQCKCQDVLIKRKVVEGGSWPRGHGRLRRQHQLITRQFENSSQDIRTLVLIPRLHTGTCGTVQFSQTNPSSGSNEEVLILPDVYKQETLFFSNVNVSGIKIFVCDKLIVTAAFTVGYIAFLKEKKSITSLL